MPRRYSHSDYDKHTYNAHEIRVVIGKKPKCSKYSDNREVKDINSISEISVFSEIIQEIERVSNIQNNNTDHDRREKFYFENKINPNRNDSNNEEYIFMFDKFFKMKI